MSKRELIVQELGRLSDRAEAAAPAGLAESARAKDWLSPEEDAA